MARQIISNVELVDCLKHALMAGDDPDSVTVSRNLIRLAIKEIEHLRSLAGAASEGKSFAEIAGRQTVQFEDEGPKGS